MELRIDTDVWNMLMRVRERLNLYGSEEPVLQKHTAVLPPPQYNMLIITHFTYSIYNIPCHKVKVCKFIKNRNMWQNIILIGKGSSLIWFSYLMRLYYYDIVGNCNGWLCHPSHHKWRGHTHWVWGVKIPLTRYWSGIGRRLWRRQSSSWVFSRRERGCGFACADRGRLL